MAVKIGRSQRTADLQRLVSQAVWDRRKADFDSDALAARRADRRVAALLDEYAQAVLGSFSTVPGTSASQVLTDELRSGHASQGRSETQHCI